MNFGLLYLIHWHWNNLLARIKGHLITLWWAVLCCAGELSPLLMAPCASTLLALQTHPFPASLPLLLSRGSIPSPSCSQLLTIFPWQQEWGLRCRLRGEPAQDSMAEGVLNSVGTSVGVREDRQLKGQQAEEQCPWLHQGQQDTCRGSRSQLRWADGSVPSLERRWIVRTATRKIMQRYRGVLFQNTCGQGVVICTGPALHYRICLTFSLDSNRCKEFCSGTYLIMKRTEQTSNECCPLFYCYHTCGTKTIKKWSTDCFSKI